MGDPARVDAVPLCAAELGCDIRPGGFGQDDAQLREIAEGASSRERADAPFRRRHLLIQDLQTSCSILGHAWRYGAWSSGAMWLYAKRAKIHAHIRGIR
jgi:hypothetical protein